MGLVDKGLNALGSIFGLGGGQGEHYKGGALSNAGLDAMNADIELSKNSTLNKAIRDISSGGSLKDALKTVENMQNQQAVLGQLASSPIAGYNIAAQQVQQNPLMSGMFGQGGLQDQSIAKTQELMNRGYSLQPEDYEAYGQAQNQIARMFGAQENNLANALAMRGMGASSSAPGAAQFSGLYGNKAEQLGQMQQQIAQRRMDTNMQRLGQMQNFVSNMQAQANAAQQGAFNANMQGQQARQNLNQAAAGQATNAFSAQQAVDQAAMNSKLANKEQGLGDLLSQGIGKAAVAAPGAALSALTANPSGSQGNVPNAPAPTNQAPYSVARGMK